MDIRDRKYDNKVWLIKPNAGDVEVKKTRKVLKPVLVFLLLVLSAGLIFTYQNYSSQLGVDGIIEIEESTNQQVEKIVDENGDVFIIDDSNEPVKVKGTVRDGYCDDGSAIPFSGICGKELGVVNPRRSFLNASDDEIAYIDHEGNVQGVGNLTFTSSTGGYGFLTYLGSSTLRITKGWFTDLDVDNSITATNVTVTKYYADDWSNVTITESQISDLSHTVDTDTTFFEIINDWITNTTTSGINTTNVFASENVTAETYRVGNNGSIIEVLANSPQITGFNAGNNAVFLKCFAGGAAQECCLSIGGRAKMCYDGVGDAEFVAGTGKGSEFFVDGTDLFLDVASSGTSAFKYQVNFDATSTSATFDGDISTTGSEDDITSSGGIFADTDMAYNGAGTDGLVSVGTSRDIGMYSNGSNTLILDANTATATDGRIYIDAKDVIITGNLSGSFDHEVAEEGGTLDPSSAEWSWGNGDEELYMYIERDITLTSLGLSCATGTGTAVVRMETQAGGATGCNITSTSTLDSTSCDNDVNAGSWMRPYTVSDSGHAGCALTISWRTR